MANAVAPVRYVHSDSPGFSGELMELLEAYSNQLELGNGFLRALIHHKIGTILDTDGFPLRCQNGKFHFRAAFVESSQIYS